MTVLPGLLLPASCFEGNNVKPGPPIGGTRPDLPSKATRQTGTSHRRRRLCEAEPKQTHGASANLLSTTVAKTENLLSRASLAPTDCFGATHLCNSATRAHLAMTVLPGPFLPKCRFEGNNGLPQNSFGESPLSCSRRGEGGEVPQPPSKATSLREGAVTRLNRSTGIVRLLRSNPVPLPQCF